MNLYNRYLLPRLTHLAMRQHVLRRYRQQTLAGAHGVVLELGFGSGLNLSFYDPERVSQLYALEPEQGMLELARTRIEQAPFPVEILQTGAEQIPLPEASVDTVISTWTLCTIPRVEQALAEVRRVLKPEGVFLFTEHGLSPEARVARWQRRLTPYWRRCAGGCHLDRNTEALLKAAGFTLDKLDTGYLGPLKAMAYMYTGRARPGSSLPS